VKKRYVVLAGVMAVAGVAAFMTRWAWMGQPDVSATRSDPLADAVLFGAMAIILLGFLARKIFKTSRLVALVDSWADAQLRRFVIALRSGTRAILNPALRIIERPKNGKKATVRPRAHLSIYFAQKFGKSSVVGTALVAFGLGYSVLIKDQYLDGFLLALLLGILLRYWLTSYRANHSFLGTNASEAEELIGFIARHSRDGSLPPDIRKYSIEDLAENKNEQSIPQGIIVGGSQ
jgi:hypothetical protein